MSAPSFPITFFPVALASAEKQHVAALDSIVKNAISAKTLISPPFLLQLNEDSWTSEDDLSLLNGNVILLDPLPAQFTSRQIQNLAAIFKKCAFVYVVSVLVGENSQEAVQRKFEALRATKVSKFAVGMVGLELKLGLFEEAGLRKLIREAEAAPPPKELGLEIKAAAITALILLTITVVFIGAAVLLAKLKRPLTPI